MQKATEEGLKQRDCVISSGPKEANVEAEEGRKRLMQSHAETRRVDTVGQGRKSTFPRLRRA